MVMIDNHMIYSCFRRVFHARYPRCIHAQHARMNNIYVSWPTRFRAIVSVYARPLCLDQLTGKLAVGGEITCNFTDHPGLKSKLPDATVGSGQSAKAKVYCSKCLESHTHAVAAEDQLAVNAIPPQRQSVRTVGEIETYCMSIVSLFA
jgi:hypothetical protein